MNCLNDTTFLLRSCTCLIIIKQLLLQSVFISKYLIYSVSLRIIIIFKSNTNFCIKVYIKVLAPFLSIQNSHCCLVQARLIVMCKAEQRKSAINQTIKHYRIIALHRIGFVTNSNLVDVSRRGSVQ